MAGGVVNGSGPAMAQSGPASGTLSSRRSIGDGMTKKKAGRTAARRTRREPARPGRRAARVEEILIAARHVLASEGYAEFTLRRIAREVKIRLSTLQHYFPSKDDRDWKTHVTDVNETESRRLGLGAEANKAG